MVRAMTDKTGLIVDMNPVEMLYPVLHAAHGYGKPQDQKDIAQDAACQGGFYHREQAGF